MSTPTTTLLYDTMMRLMHRGAQKNLENMISKSHAMDLAHVIRQMDIDQNKKYIFSLADLPKKAAILQELGGEQAVSLIKNLGDQQIVDIFHEMPSNAVTDVIGFLPDDISEKLLTLMGPKGSQAVEELLKYPQDCAGGIMTKDFCALHKEMTAEETIQKLQQDLDLDHVFYVYIVNGNGQLVGVLSLRKLLQVKPQAKIEEIMITDVIRVRTDTDQEEVAKIVARYNLLALPVVDEQNTLVGIVTVDDIVDVVREEATEDILKMGGVGDIETLEKSSFKSACIRLPWLFVSLLGGIIALKVMAYFQTTLQESIALAFFIPLMMGMSGNLATQSSTIVVSGLALGKIRIKKIGWVLWKELKVGIMFGVVCGLIIGTFASIQYGQYGTSFSSEHLGEYVGWVVGGALVISMILASLVGVLLPIIFERFNIDPALSTGPFVITVVDVLGILIYLYLASLFHGAS